MNKLARRTTTADGIRLFDEEPIKLHGFEFKSRSVEPIGLPTAEQFEAAWTFASAVEEASPYWVGDLMAYAETRTEWRERLDQMMSRTGLAEQTIINRTYVARHVAPEERNLAPSPAHAACVAPMDPAHQSIWLEKARAEGWTVSEFRNEIRAASRRKVIEGQAVLSGMYRVIYADPPWRYRDSNATSDGSLGKAERHYPSMTMEELSALPVAAHAMKHSILFCWATTPMLVESPGPLDVIRAWGFTPKSIQTWDKVLGMPGRFLQITTEHLVIAERGQCPPDKPTPKPKSLFTERRSSEHSAKPKVTRMMIEKLYTSGPYLELFAREQAEGWDVFGNDPKLWK